MTLEEGKRYLLKSEEHEMHVLRITNEPNDSALALCVVMDLGHTGTDVQGERYRLDGSYYFDGTPSDRDVLRELPQAPKPAEPLRMMSPSGIYSKGGMPMHVWAPKAFVRVHGWPEVRILPDGAEAPEGYQKLMFKSLPEE